MSKKEKVSVRKSYRANHIALRVELKSYGFQSDSITLTGSTDLTTVQARALSCALIKAAEEIEARENKRTEAEERRAKWREREIKAGRLKVLSASEFFKR